MKDKISIKYLAKAMLKNSNCPMLSKAKNIPHHNGINVLLSTAIKVRYKYGETERSTDRSRDNKKKNWKGVVIANIHILLNWYEIFSND